MGGYSSSDYVVKVNPGIINYNWSWDIGFGKVVKSALRYSSYYGLDTNVYDSHNTRLSEYAAVLYLSQSKYGKMGNYKKNNNSNSPHIYINEYPYTGMSSGNYMEYFKPYTETEYAERLSKVWDYNEDHTKTVTCEQTGSVSRPSISVSNNGWSNSSGTYTTQASGKDASSSSISFSFSVLEEATVSFNYSKSLTSCSLSYSISGPTSSSGSASSSTTTVSKVLSPGNYTVTFNFSKDSTLLSVTRSGSVSNFSVVAGGWEDNERTNYQNGIGASTTGNVYGVYDLGRKTMPTVIVYNSNRPVATFLSKEGLSDLNSKYYEVIKYVSSTSIVCESSPNCDGYGLYTEIPSDFYYNQCDSIMSDGQYFYINKDGNMSNLVTYPNNDEKSPYCYEQVILVDQNGRIVLSSNN